MNTAQLNLNLGDKRLNSRCNKIVSNMLKKPASSIPQFSGSWHNTKATYRFFANTSVSENKIMEAHIEQTCKRIADCDDVILVAQDTTDVSYAGHKLEKGLGYFVAPDSNGIKVHSCLALSEFGTPLGLLSQQMWIRPKSLYGKSHIRPNPPIEDKESFCWIQALIDIENKVPANKTAVAISDRGSDMYELFAKPRKENIHLLVRSCSDRSVDSSHKKLSKLMQSLPVSGKVSVNLIKGSNHKPKSITLEIRHKEVTLIAPRRRGHETSKTIDTNKPVSLFCVYATEKVSKHKVDPVSWTLLTTCPVTSFSDAKRIVDWYTKRWLVERFHFVLKSGCKIEEIQLRSLPGIKKAVSVYSHVAWQLMYLVYQSREKPDLPCTTFLSNFEWKTLTTFFDKKNTNISPPTVIEAVKMIARLGGYLNRNSDNDPGVRVLWTGLKRFSDVIEFARKFKND